jgi:Fic family protein
MATPLDEMKARWDSLQPIPPEMVAKIDARLEARFVSSSNIIEDRTAPTLSETEVFLESALTSAGRSIDDFVGLERHREALAEARAKARAAAPLSVDLCRSLHNTLTRGLRDKDYGPGEWKIKANRPTTRRGRTFRYAAPADVPDLMRDLVAGYEGLAARVHPIQAITWWSYHFHLIHPFNEANGRLSRLVSSFLLLKTGFRELVIDPDERGAYLDALSACDATVPADRLAPLYSGIETGTLVAFFSGCVERTLSQALNVVEGTTPESPADVARASQRMQKALVTRLRETNSTSIWRHDAAIELKLLHERIGKAMLEAQDEGTLYSIAVEVEDPKSDHGADARLRAVLPGGGAGIVGETTLVIRPKTTTAVKMPAPRKLLVAIAGSKLGLHVFSLWDDETKPTVRHGPRDASQWSDAGLERVLATRIETGRRAFDAGIVELNKGQEQRGAMRALTTKRPRLAVRVAEELKAEAAAAPKPAEVRRRPRDSGRLRKESARSSSERRSKESGSLEGIRPVDPPLSL